MGHIRASAQFGPNSRNAEKECFWGTFGLQANLVRTGAPATHPPTHPGATHPPTHPSGFLGTFRLQPNLVRTPGMPKTNVFGHIQASAQIWSEQPICRKRMFLGTFGLQPNLVRTAGMPKTNLFGHIRASAQFGLNSRNAEKECFWAHSGFRPTGSKPCRRHPPTHPPTRAPPTHPPTHPPGRNECFWAHSGFSPIWSEQPECRKRMFLGTFGLQANLVQTGRHPPVRAPPTRAPPTHPATHPPTRAPGMFLGTFRLQPNLVRKAGMPKTNLFGHIRASAQFGPNSRNAEKECFWAHSGFRPIWSEPGATHPPTHPPTHPGATHPTTNPPTRAPRTFLGTFRLQPNLVRTAGKPKPNLFGHIRASAQIGPNSRNAKNESVLAHSGFSPLWSEQPECHKRIFLGTFGLQPNLVRIAGKPKTNLFGHFRASAQFGPNSRNAENESFWAPSGFWPIWSEPGATQAPTHPPTRAPPNRAPPTQPPTHPPGRHECFWAHSGFSPIWSEQPEYLNRIFLGTFRLQPNLVRTAGTPKTNLFWHIRASAQFGPNSRNAEKECFWAHSGFWPIWSKRAATHPPTHPPRRHPPGRHPPTHPPTHPGATNVFGHFLASAQFGPNSRNAEKECFWAHSGFRPIWSEPGATQAPTHPPTRAPPTRAPPTQPPTHPPGRHECFWAHSGFSPIWSEQPESQNRIFLGTFGLQPNLVRTAGTPKTNLFGHIRASAQIGPNSRNAKNESVLAHSGFSPIWSEQPECHKRTFLGTFGLQPNLVRIAGKPKTNLFGHIRASAQFGPNSRNAENESFWAPSGFWPIWSKPGTTHPPTHQPFRAPPTQPPTHPPTRAPRMFLGTFRLQPNWARTAGMPRTNLFGHIRASAQFGPNSRNAENERFWAHSGFRPIWSEPGATQAPTHPPTRAPPNRAPPTQPPTHPPGRHECFWAHSGFSPIWSEKPESLNRICLGTFRLQPDLVRTAGTPKTNLFWHIRASAQFGPNSRNAEKECFWAHSGFWPIWSKRAATHPPTHPSGRHPPGRHPPTHPPTQPGATNVFGHFLASAQFGPNSRNAEKECFWAHSGFRPIWSEPGATKAPTHPPTRAPPTRAPPTQPPTHPPGRHECFWAHSGFSPIWSEQPESQNRIFLGTFGLQPNLVRTAGTPKTNLFWHIRASAQFGPNSRNAEKECFWAHSGFWPIWSKRAATHPPTHPPGRHPPGRHPPTNPPTHPPGRHECFWALSGFSPIWSEQPECRKGLFLGTFGLLANLVQTGRDPPTHPPTRAPPTRAPPTHPPTHPPGRHECFWALSGFSPIRSEQPECRKGTFLGTFGLLANLVQTGRHPPTHPPTRAPPTRAPPTQPPTHPPGHHE